MAKDKNERTTEQPRAAHETAIARWREALQYTGTHETPHRRRMKADEIVSDKKILRHLEELAALPHLHHSDARADRIDAIARFIEEAAALPDQQPPGAHLRRDANEPLTFSTPKALKQDLAKAHTTAGTLINVIERTAPTLQERFPLGDAYQLIELLEKFSAAAVHTSADFAKRQQIDQRAKANRRDERDFETPTEGTPVSPGAVAGKNSGRNWLLQKVGQLAVVHLGTSTDDELAKKIRGEIRALSREVTRVLMGCEETINERTADDHLPNVALVPAEGQLKLDDWRNEIDL